MEDRRQRRSTTAHQRWGWPHKWLIGRKGVVDKLMDGSVDNPMDNPAGCPQVAAQAAHELTHDGLFGFSTTRFFILFPVGCCLDRGVHLTSQIVSVGMRLHMRRRLFQHDH